METNARYAKAMIYYDSNLYEIILKFTLDCRRQREHSETARELDESVAGDKLYMRYEVDVEKSYQRQAPQEGSLKGAQLPPPPGVNCDTLHHHQGADLDIMKQAPAPHGPSGTLTRPGSGQYSRQHIYESPTFT